MENIQGGKGRKTARIIFNAVLIIGAAVGVGIDLAALDAVMALAAFTIQSNIFCLIMAGVTVMRETRPHPSNGRAYIFFKGMALTSILLTFMVYNFVLAPYLDPTNQAASGVSLANILLHVAVPLMTLADFLIFEERGAIRLWHPFGWTAFPFFYVGYTAVYKALGGIYRFTGDGSASNFPYFFLDYETYGLKTVMIWCVFIAIGFIGFSYLLVGLDGIFTKLRKKK